MHLLFVHGAGGSPEVWYHQTRYFGGSHAVRLPGHPQGQGMSSIDDYADWVAGVIRDKGRGPAAVCGHSMGGAIAQSLALRHPKVIIALILVGTGAKLKVHPELLSTLTSDYPGAVDSLVKMAFGRSAPASMVAQSARQMVRIPAEVTRGDFEACDRFDIRSAVGLIDLPTLIICGSEDRMTPPRYSEFLKEKIPGARLVLIEGAGHMVMLERTGKVSGAIEEFVLGL